MNKALVSSIAVLFAILVCVEQSQQQETMPTPVTYAGCTCVAKPHRERGQRQEGQTGQWGQRQNNGQFGRRGRDHQRRMPNITDLPAVFSQPETNTIGRFFCACPN